MLNNTCDLTGGGIGIGPGDNLLIEDMNFIECNAKVGVLFI